MDCERDIWVDGTTANGMLQIPLPPGSATMNVNGGIREAQGDYDANNLPSNKAAGNTFLRNYITTPSTPHFDVYYNANTNCKYYYQNGASTGYVPTNIFPTNSLQFSTQGISVTTVCPPYVPVTAMTTADAWQQRNNALFEQTVLENTLRSLEDGGNTPLTKNEVAMTQIQNAYQLYANLMAKSPYLSEEVLAELAEKENFPKPLLRDIMVANKHAGKNVEIWQKLENRTEELPSYMMEQIQNAAQSGWSAKEFLEYQISQKSEVYHNAIAAQVSLLDNDSNATLSDYDAVLSTANGENYQKDLIELALHFNDANAATQYLDNMSSDDAMALEDYKTVKTILINLQAAGKTISQADSTQRSILENLVGDANEGQAEAQVIWESLGNTTTYHEPYPTSVSNTQQRIKKASKPVKEMQILRVAPNPAHDYITFEIANSIDTQANLIVYDAQGRTIQQKEFVQSFTLNTSILAAGIYFYKYTDPDGQSVQGKFNIQH